MILQRLYFYYEIAHIQNRNGLIKVTFYGRISPKIYAVKGKSFYTFMDALKTVIESQDRKTPLFAGLQQKASTIQADLDLSDYQENEEPGAEEESKSTPPTPAQPLITPEPVK